MPFMVIYRTSDGSSLFEQADAIDQAALFVERLRNSEGIDQIRIYRMEEISFAFRPYYKVELGLPDRQAPAPPTEVVNGVTVVEELPLPPGGDEIVESVELAHDDDVLTPDLPPPPGEVTAEGADANGARRGLFGR